MTACAAGANLGHFYASFMCLHQATKMGVNLNCEPGPLASVSDRKHMLHEKHDEKKGQGFHLLCI